MDAVVPQVRNVQSARSVHRQPVRKADLRARGTGDSSASDRRNDPAWSNFAHPVVIGVRDVNVAGTIDTDALGVAKSGLGRRSAVAYHAAPRHRLNKIGLPAADPCCQYY